MCEATSKAIQAEAEGIVNENYKVKFYLLTKQTNKNKLNWTLTKHTKDRNVCKWKMELMEDFLVPWFILDMNQILERIVQGHIVEAKMTFILDDEK